MFSHNGAATINFNPEPDAEEKQGSAKQVAVRNSFSIGSDSKSVFRHEVASWRRNMEKVFLSKKTEVVLATAILLSLLALVAETDAEKVDGKTPLWLRVTNSVLLAFFTIESLARVFTFRWYVLDDRWEMFDLLIVSAELTMTILRAVVKDMPSIMMMRIVRLLRVFRTTALTKRVPQLHIIVLSMAGAADTLVWGGVMIVLMLMVCGILGVQMIHPVIKDLVEEGGFKDCDRCKRSFESVWQASLTMLQSVICGDSWGLVSLPVIEHSPWTMIFFGAVIIMFSMALLNIIMANIVDAVMQARAANDAFMADIRRQERLDAKNVILAYCKALDADNSGSLTYDEFKEGYARELGFRQALNAMDVRTDDLDTVWTTLDEDNSGDVSYTEFCDQLYKMKYSHGHTMLMIVKSTVMDIRKKLGDQVKLVQEDVMAGLRATEAAIQLHQEVYNRILDRVNEIDDKICNNDSRVISTSSQRPAGPSPPVVEPDIGDRASSEPHLAIQQHLDSMSKLNQNFERKVAAFSAMISEFRTRGPHTPMLAEEWSGGKEGSSARHAEAKDLSRTVNDGSRTNFSSTASGATCPRSDSYPAFAMCCAVGPPRSNAATISREPASKSGEQYRSLVAIPNGLSTKPSPQQELTAAETGFTPVATDVTKNAPRV